MRIARRALTVGLASALAAPRTRADSPSDAGSPPLLGADLVELRTLRLEHEVVVALPRAPAAPVPLVVLLHGLAETSDEHAGSRAWVDRYGLTTSIGRLHHAPLGLVSARDDWGSSLASTNTALGAHPYRGLGIACPYVPRMSSGKLDAFGEWIARDLIPRVRADAGDRLDASPARVGGCSYGGWVSLEVFLRAPGRFHAWAGIQTAIAHEAAAAYADRMARIAAGVPLLIETSTRDPFHDANVAFAGMLRARSVPCDLVVLPGPHDQAWLREAGTPSALAWLDRS